MKKEKKDICSGRVLLARLLLIIGMYGMAWQTEVSARGGDRGGDRTGDRGAGDNKPTDKSSDKPKEPAKVPVKASKPVSRAAAPSTSKGRGTSSAPRSQGGPSTKSGSSARKASAGDMGIMPVRGSRGSRRSEETPVDIGAMNEAEYNEHLIKLTDAVTTKNEAYSSRFTEYTKLVNDTKPQAADSEYAEKKKLWDRFQAGLKEALNV